MDTTLSPTVPPDRCRPVWLHAAIAALAALLCLFAGIAAAATPLAELPAAPLGRHLSAMVENDHPLTVEQARAALLAGRFSPQSADVPRFGIGSAPAWLHLAVDNDGPEPARRQLQIEASWLDRIDVHLLHDGRVVSQDTTGDAVPGAALPHPGLGYLVDLVLPPGRNDLLVRIATPDTMVVPLRLLDAAQLKTLQRQTDYMFGFLYGFLLALIGYNAMLWFGLRERSFLDYTLYVGGFLLLNLCYTGHGYIYLWPRSQFIQQYCIPVMMVVSGCAGLRFADGFLQLKEHLPGAHRFVRGLTFAGLAGMLVTVLLLRQQDAVLFGFVFVLTFSVTLFVLGLMTVRTGRVPGRYYLAGVTAAMLGIVTTALANWFALPYSFLTYHAAGIGVALEGILLALALAYRMREHQRARLEAEQLARIDPLTGLFNRRAFVEHAGPVLSTAQRGGRPLAVILLDIDHFKAINDSRGHEAGDRTIEAVAALLAATSRAGDVVARWGGEEFIALLPETDAERAAILAERLRAEIAAHAFGSTENPLAVTASFGIAARRGDESLDDLIRAADHRLYAAKEGGRNRVEAAD